MTNAVICRNSTQYFAGQGLWAVASIDVLPTEQIPDLVHGLTEQDVPAVPNQVCSAVGHIPVDFVLTLANGSRIRPRLPSDGCQPKWDTLKPFNSAVTRSKIKVSQVSTELEVSTGCGSEAKGPAIWLGTSSTRGSNTAWALPTADNGRFGVCRYQGTTQGEGTLNGHAKLITTTELHKIWPIASATPPPGCPPTSDTLPTLDWLEVTQPPPPPTDGLKNIGNPIALVELSGCRRVVAPDTGLIGYLTQAQTAVLKDLV